jgi:hypothetical protein
VFGYCRYGGRPIGSFMPMGDEVIVRPVGAHALFMDTTHDNEPPVQVCRPQAAVFPAYFYV